MRRGRDRLARTVPDARSVADEPEKGGFSHALRKEGHDRNNPRGRMFFNILATFAELESVLIPLRTREGMEIARDKGKLRDKPPKLFDLLPRLLGLDRHEMSIAFATQPAPPRSVSVLASIARSSLSVPFYRDNPLSSPEGLSAEKSIGTGRNLVKLDVASRLL